MDALRYSLNGIMMCKMNKNAWQISQRPPSKFSWNFKNISTNFDTKDHFFLFITINIHFYYKQYILNLFRIIIYVIYFLHFIFKK